MSIEERLMTIRDSETIVELIQKRAERHPDRPYLYFLEDGDHQSALLSYKDMEDDARRVAAWLYHQGVEKGDRVITILPNSVEFVQIFYGCLFAGVLAVPLSEPGGPHHMQSYLNAFIPTLKVSQPKLLITTPFLVDLIQNQLPPEVQPVFKNLQVVSDQEIIQSPDHPDFQCPDLSGEDTAYLQFTSGSTGTPKGIMIGHRNIMANMKQAYTTCEWEAEAGTALWLPLFHDFGLAAGMIGAIYMGGFVVLTTPINFIFKPIRWLKMISDYKCAYSYAPPFAYEICRKKISNEEKEQLDLSSLVCSVYGAEPVQFEGVRGFTDAFQTSRLNRSAIRPGFGMAETVIMFSVSRGLSALCVDRSKLETSGNIEFAEEDRPESEKKYLVDLGPMMDEHEIVIKNEQNQALPEGRVGEIVISGPSVCQGYYNNPEETEAVFRQKIEGKEANHLATGDLGLLWKGHLYFTGRIKDLIIIRGRNYYPQDIEYALTYLKELRAGCIVAYSEMQPEGEQLCLAMEVRKDLLKDISLFNDYVLPTIDRKVTDLIGHKFQIHPEKRIYLKPGVITKTSSGKIKHAANVTRFKAGNIEGILAQLPESSDSFHLPDDIALKIARLFTKVVEIEAVFDAPFLELGGDSIKIVEFVEILQNKYPALDFDLMDSIDESTTLNDLVQWISSGNNKETA